ncbi:hypothetical protein OIE68_09385 [Nocardia vinacea]|uniref:hypothetical protein n=1 Tax=Nocardia vinacea TaxID=96468 RepID=UPI002E128EFF|nr:hypothetical protein OIE68_09385 [Nocardia vinacea]
MARFRLEEDLPIPGHAVLSTRLGSEDLDELIETARLWALRATSSKQLRLYDRSVELLAVEGCGVALVNAVDEWVSTGSRCASAGRCCTPHRSRDGPAGTA